MSQGQKVWLVFSVEHTAWWRANRSGYTLTREDAGRYTLEEARMLAKQRSPDAEGMPGEIVEPAPEFESTLAALSLRERRLREALKPLVKFGLAILDHWHEDHGCDIDGTFVQDAAESCGVTECIKVDKACHEDQCACAEITDFPTNCIRSAPCVAAARSALAQETREGSHE